MANIRIRHSEYIQDVISSGTSLAFKIQTININPGLAQSFPWLSQLAVGYQYYRIRNFTVRYQPTCATAVANSTNLSLGFVLLRAVHDVTAAADLYEQQMDCSYQTIRGLAYKMFELDCEKKGETVRERSIRTGAQPANTDLRFFDDFYIEVASSGVVGTTQTLGKLYFDYDVELIRPQLAGGIIGNQLLDAHYQPLVTSTTNILGTSQPKVYDQIGLTFVTPSTCNAFSFPSWIQTGVFQITLLVSGGSNGSMQAPTLSLTNGSILSNIAGASALSGFTAPHNGTEETSTVMSSVFFVQITAPSAVVTFANAGGSWVSSTAYCDLFVVQTSSLMLT